MQSDGCSEGKTYVHLMRDGKTRKGRENENERGFKVNARVGTMHIKN